MHIQPTGNADSWSQFVRLVAEARTRSKSAAAAAETASPARATPSLGKPTAPLTARTYAGSAPAAALAAPRHGEMTASSGATGTVGSFFDAYA